MKGHLFIMEEIKNASISINLNEGNINISGSEEFVEKNMETVFSFVKDNIKNTNISKKENKNKTTEIKEVSTNIKEKEIDDIEDKYIKAGVYHIDSDDETISILKKIPGGTKAEKVKNIALIVLHIKKGKIQGKELIPICEKHACYDSSNFSSTFKNEKTNIIRKGTGQTWTLELTQPGEKAALALLEEMANDKK